jgi:hypothetical protein
MKTVAGTFLLLSSSADTYIGCGFVPDWVKVYSMNANEEKAHWSIHMARHGSTLSGISYNDDGDVSADTFETGIQIHRGGHIVTAAEYAASMYLVKDDLDYSKTANIGAAYSEINKWYFVTGQTGYWNNPCDTDFVGVGSRICIDGKWYIISALTSNGEVSAEVTLSEANVVTGDIQAITGMYDYRPAVTGTVSPAGFWIDATSDVLNATSEIAWFEAGTYDN